MEEGKTQRKKRGKAAKIARLFISSLTINAVAFGGGFVILSLLRSTFVKKLQWTGEEELMDMNALAQASPGTIAINTLFFIGLKVGGVLGAAATLLGGLIPPMAAMTALYFFYDAIKSYAVVNFIMAGMQAGVAAVILSLVIDTWKSVLKTRSPFAVTLLAVSFTVSTITQFFFGLSVITYIVILSAVAGIAFSYLSYYREGKKK